MPQQRQQRKSQNDEVIALDALEQLDAALLELIRPHTRGDRGSRSIEIVFEKTVGKRAHGEPRRFAMLEQDRALPHESNRGVKTGNVPVVPGVEVPRHVETLSRPLVVGLYASPERIVQIRQNRLLGLKAHHDDDQYIDRKAVAEEVAFSRKLCSRHNWPSIDVTRRSIEETAAAVMSFLAERRRQPLT